VGEVVPGIVTKLATFGAFARIEGPVEGLIHVSELVDRRIAHAQEAVREGDILPLRIIRIERDRHRLGLSLKQARDRGEMMGFRFGPDGEVTYVPEDVKAAFRDELNALLEARTNEDVAAALSEAEAAEAPLEEAVPALIGARQQAAEQEEEEEPQTQMAAAFAALKMEDLASDPPPEETKA
jgi:small subunit ribosomal protein S1